MPDPSVQSVSGSGRDAFARVLDGIEKKIDPGPPINKNIYKMSHREAAGIWRIDELPGNLSEALDELEKDDLVRDTLGDPPVRAFRSPPNVRMARTTSSTSSPWEIRSVPGDVLMARPRDPAPRQ